MNDLAIIVSKIKQLETEIERLKRVEYPTGGGGGGVTPTYEWFDWTPSYTGWSSLPAGTYRYCIVGKILFGLIDMTDGTSSATSASISLPPASKRDGVFYGGTNAYAMNNGSVLTVATRWEIGSTIFNTSINFYTNMGTGAWTASGTKRIRCNFMYELA